MEFHPDRNHGFKKEAEQKMKDLNNARDYILNHFDEYEKGWNFYEEKKYEKKQEKKTENQNKNTESKREEESLNNAKIKRLKIVLFFVWLILVPFFAKWIWIDIDSDKYNSPWYLTNLLIFTIPYMIFLDLVKRLINYVNKGINEWYVPNDIIIEIVRFIFIIIIIVLIINIIYNVFIGYKNWKIKIQKVQCLSNNWIINPHWWCECSEWFVMSNDWKCKKYEKVYDDWEISFTYPWKLIVTNKEFEDFKFFEKENIHVKKYNFDSLIWKCIEWWSDVRSDWSVNEKNKLLKDLTLENKSILKNIQEWKEFDNNLDHFSCYSTVWSYKSTPIKLDWLNWVILNYYFTQDPWMWCLTQFNTELLLVKDLNNIYSIMFKNNFWDVFNYLSKYKWEYWEICISNNSEEWDKISNLISKFYESWVSLIWTEYEVFEKNDKIIKEIINSVKIKK